MTYFVINNSDGDTRIRALTREELLEKLGENFWGDVDFVKHLALDVAMDTNYLNGNVLIIEGEIVIPKPVKVVKAFTLP